MTASKPTGCSRSPRLENELYANIAELQRVKATAGDTGNKKSYLRLLPSESLLKAGDEALTLHLNKQMMCLSRCNT